MRLLYDPDFDYYENLMREYRLRYHCSWHVVKYRTTEYNESIEK